MCDVFEMRATPSSTWQARMILFMKDDEERKTFPTIFEG